MFEMMPFTRSRGMDLYRPFRDLEDLERREGKSKLNDN